MLLAVFPSIRVGSFQVKIVHHSRLIRVPLLAAPEEHLEVAQLDNNKLINLMDAIAPLSAVFKERFRRSEITGFILESITESVLSSITVDGEYFSPLELSLILSYQNKLKKISAEQENKRKKISEEEENKRKKILAEEENKLKKISAEEEKKQKKLAFSLERAENSRTVQISSLYPITTPGSNICYRTFTSEASFSSFLKDSNLISLARMRKDGTTREEFRDLFLLENDTLYFSVPKVTTYGDFDVEKEVREMINVVRTRADYSTQRYLEDFYRVNLTFVGHEIKLIDACGVDKGDIDSLFESDGTHFLVERKRTIGQFDEIYGQISKTQAAYKAIFLDAKKITRDLVSILYTESINEDTSQKLLKKGIHVLQDSIECRFISDANYKNFMRLGKT